MNNQANAALVGKTIKAVEVTDDGFAIKFVTDGGDVIATVEADCCSETWIEHIELPAGGFPALVFGVEDIEDVVEVRGDEDDEDGCVAFYACKVKTNRGEIIVDYRNRSNGYYGGNLSWPGGDYGYERTQYERLREFLGENSKWIQATEA